jgi:hypothetical protein
VASKLTEVIVDAADPEKIAAFWMAALGYEKTGDHDGWVQIGDPDAPWVSLTFVPVPEPKAIKNRPTSISARSAVIRTRRWRGWWGWAPAESTSARARRAGSCWPTQTATNSACSGSALGELPLSGGAGGR